MENNSHIISIYGPIGVGKTTVLNYLNNQFLLQRSYDFVIFLVFHHSNSELQDEIAKQIGLSDAPAGGWNQKGFDEKGAAIFDLLSGKRYAILIDDLSCTFKVLTEKIGFPRPNSENKCKLVVAYELRHNYFANKLIPVMPLLWEDAWCLFKQVIGGDVHPQFSGLAAQVALLCQGLPDTLVKIARLMKFNTRLEEWDKAIEILKKCDKNVPVVTDTTFLQEFQEREHLEDLAQTLCDELGRNRLFQARVVAQTKPAATSYDHDRFCKIRRGLAELKDTLAEFPTTIYVDDQMIIKQSLDILDGLSSYASLV